MEIGEKTRKLEGEVNDLSKSMEFANAEIEDLTRNDKENEVKIKELEEKYRLCFKTSLVGDHYVNFLNDRDHFLGQTYSFLFCFR